MKKLLLFIFIIFLTGCTLPDIGNIAVVSSIGISHDKEVYTVYVKILATDDDNEDVILTKTCLKLDDCFYDITKDLSKKLYLTQMDLLVIDDNIEKKNIDEIINFFLSQKSSRNSFSIIATDKINDKIFKNEEKDINNMLDLSISTNAIVKRISFDSVLKDILNFNISFIPYLKFDDVPEVISYKEIYENSKVLSKDESIAVNIIRGNLKNFTFVKDGKKYNLENCTTSCTVKDDVNIKFVCDYIGNDAVNILNINLEGITSDYLKNNDKNYLNYIYYKYKNSLENNVNYNITVSVKKLKTNGGEMFG